MLFWFEIRYRSGTLGRASPSNTQLTGVYDGEGAPVIADPLFDIFLSIVKNERAEGEQGGVATLGEIAEAMSNIVVAQCLWH